MQSAMSSIQYPGEKINTSKSLAPSNTINYEPGTMKVCSAEDLVWLYPYSFDQLVSLQGEHDMN